MNETLKILKERRSVKKYKDIKIEKILLDEILEAGKFAANGRGAQSGCMIVTQNSELVKKLEKLNAEILGRPDAEPFYGAPTVIAVFADSTRHTYIEDGSLILGNLMITAHSLGVDSCWIHRAREVFETEEGKKLASEWGLSETYKGIGFCILGYRDCEYPVPKPRKEDFVKVII
ncbi:MAG: nitroreductase family protein [Leptotrichiaceae bacterium]|nr:nitroreductase family protein [Leptotrichiaceae bacterium]